MLSAPPSQAGGPPPPSGGASRWKAVGATASGVRRRPPAQPGASTLVSTADTFRKILGRSRTRRQAFSLARSVSLAPRAARIVVIDIGAQQRPSLPMQFGSVSGHGDSLPERRRERQ